jgi:uridine kinase
LIAGATGSGKTTLLKAMLAATSQRVIAVEDVTELKHEKFIIDNEKIQLELKKEINNLKNENFNLQQEKLKLEIELKRREEEEREIYL